MTVNAGRGRGKNRTGTTGIAVAAGLAAAIALSTAAARAGEAGGANETTPAYVTAAIGAFDVIARDDAAADFRLEYRHGRGLFGIRPWLGIEATSDGAVHGLGGLLYDLHLGGGWILTPTLGVGAYHDGDGKDLGHTVEFRSQIELGYQFANRARLAVTFSHTSNADLGDRNPGTETLTLQYALPFDVLGGK